MGARFLGFKVIQDEGEDVRHFWFVLPSMLDRVKGRECQQVSHLHAQMNLLDNPSLKSEKLKVQAWDLLEKGQKPHEVTKDGKQAHIGVHRRQEEMLNSGCEHVEGFSKPKIAHNVESIKVKPITHVDWSLLGSPDFTK